MTSECLQEVSQNPIDPIRARGHRQGANYRYRKGNTLKLMPRHPHLSPWFFQLIPGPKTSMRQTVLECLFRFHEFSLRLI